MRVPKNSASMEIATTQEGEAEAEEEKQKTPMTSPLPPLILPSQPQDILQIPDEDDDDDDDAATIVCSPHQAKEQLTLPLETKEQLPSPLGARTPPSSPHSPLYLS